MSNDSRGRIASSNCVDHPNSVDFNSKGFDPKHAILVDDFLPPYARTFKLDKDSKMEYYLPKPEHLTIHADRVR
jgi:hypothetical protein